MRSIFNGHGHMLNDNRCSGGAREEADVLGCNHCQRLILKCEWISEPTYCPQCDEAVCMQCHARIRDHGCEPFIAQLNAQLKAAYHREQNARMLGI